MSSAIGGIPASTPSPSVPKTEEEKKLKKVVGDLEGLFVAQLYKAMRDTVPQQDGIVSGGSGEEIFTGLLDEHLAAETPKHWSGGIGEALYRQLRHGLPTAAVSDTPVPATIPDPPSISSDLRSR